MSNLLQQLSNYSRLSKNNILVSSPNKIISNDWFPEVFGFDEKETLAAKSLVNKSRNIDNLIESVPYDEESGYLYTPKSTYHAGWFISPTVNEIRNALQTLNLPKGQPLIEVVPGKDIGEVHIQGLALECFQGASQLNALEMVDIDEIPQNGIENYIYDNTQGPRTALSCAPGTFVRNYWLFKRNCGQFNALEYSNISHTNGYLIWGTDPNDILSKLNTDLLMIPAMIHTQVAGITKKYGNVVYHCEDKLVHQVYSSGVPVNTYRNGGNTDIQLQIARKLIYSSYIGAIGLSILLHSIDTQNGHSTSKHPIVNLTLIGAGVFNVPEEIVIEELQRAISAFSITCHIKIHGYAQSTSDKLSRTFASIAHIPPAISTSTSPQKSVVPMISSSRPLKKTIAPIIPISSSSSTSTNKSIAPIVPFSISTSKKNSYEPIRLSEGIDLTVYSIYFIQYGRLSKFPLRPYQISIFGDAIRYQYDHLYQDDDVKVKIIVYISQEIKEYVYGFIGEDNLIKLFLPTSMSNETATLLLQEAYDLYLS